MYATRQQGIPNLLRTAVIAVLAVNVSTPAFAQRADDNVTAQSDDAFGRSVGNERIGIYNPGEVRGFSPIDAGNVRMEGLYFDRQTDPTGRLVEGSTIRVGIAAQSYPFPSPTGIVDYDLRRVGEQSLISTVLTYGPFDSLGAEIDAQFPLKRDELGVAIGAGLYRDAYQWGGDSEAVSFAVIPRWKPAANIEIRPFFSGVVFRGEEPQPLMITRDAALPPKIRRDYYFGQSWAQTEAETMTSGLIGEALFGEWNTRIGVFESVFATDQEFAELFTDIDASGRANELVIAFPASRFASTSGELRTSRAFVENDRRHAVIFNVRARHQKRRYGGEDLIDAGSVQLGVRSPMAEPDYDFGSQTRDDVKQQTAGAAYELRWRDRGEMSLGVQRTSYSKTVDTPNGALPASEDDLWLKNATATVHASTRLAFYGSYTEGLEESPIAPANAVNRNVAPPALETTQYDAGIRWALPANLKLIAGVFHVEKPYFDVDGNGFFTNLGTVEHQGIELSIAGSPIENFTLVAGTRLLDAEVSGPIVDAGAIGREPVRTAKNYSIISMDYKVPGTAFSVDATAESISPQVANTANTVEVPERAVLHLGGRYRFTMLGKPVTLRAQVANVFDRYGWSAVSSGVYVYNAPRRFMVYMAADI